MNLHTNAWNFYYYHYYYRRFRTPQNFMIFIAREWRKEIVLLLHRSETHLTYLGLSCFFCKLITVLNIFTETLEMISDFLQYDKILSRFTTIKLIHWCFHNLLLIYKQQKHTYRNESGALRLILFRYWVTLKWFTYQVQVLCTWSWVLLLSDRKLIESSGLWFHDS